MSIRIAVKRLSAVEIDPTRSHQHEFHAGRLRRELEFGDDKVSGPMTALIFEEDGQPSVVDDAAFTLYDARADNPARSAEWHLYYTSRVLAEHSHAGDLLILYRADSILRAVVVRRGTRIERDLLDALSLGEAAIRERFSFLDAPTADEPQARGVAEQLTLEAPRRRAYEVSDHSLYARAVRDGHMPTTAEMASAAGQIVISRGLATVDPDDYLIAALTAETDLYYGIESELQSTRLAELMAENPTVTDVLDFAMTVQQSRRSRRGQSLQNHFAGLLALLQLPYSAQCATEDRETPDFVIPGCREYHDLGFPSERLRMVACKSTARERWRQVLHEAARIPEKYLLTLDQNLTDATIRSMVGARLQPFLPRAIQEASYARRAGAASLETVGDLVRRLREVA